MKRAAVLIVLLLAGSLWAYVARIRPAREVDATVRGTGSIEATTVLISAKLPARIVALPVEEGAAVEAGQLLAQLDCAELEVRRAQAEAQLAQAQAARVQALAGERQARAQGAPIAVQNELAAKERARAENLLAAQATTQRALDQADAAVRTTAEQLRVAELSVAVARSAIDVVEAQVRLAEKSLALVDTQLAECKLVAPRAGVVLRKLREVGELVLPGATLVELGELDEVFTWIYVPNEEVGRVRLGQKVELAADTYPDRVFAGTVARVNEQAEFTPRSIQTKEDRTRLVFGVKVVVPNPDRALLPGMPVEARLVEAAAE